MQKQKPNFFIRGKRISDPHIVELYGEKWVRFLMGVKRSPDSLRAKTSIDPEIWVNALVKNWSAFQSSSKDTEHLEMSGYLVTKENEFEMLATNISSFYPLLYEHEGGYCTINGTVTLRFQPSSIRKNKKLLVEILKVMTPSMQLPEIEKYQKFSITALRLMAKRVENLNLKSQSKVEVKASIFQCFDEKLNIRRTTWSLKDITVCEKEIAP